MSKTPYSEFLPPEDHQGLLCDVVQQLNSVYVRNRQSPNSWSSKTHTIYSHDNELAVSSGDDMDELEGGGGGDRIKSSR